MPTKAPTSSAQCTCNHHKDPECLVHYPITKSPAHTAGPWTTRTEDGIIYIDPVREDLPTIASLDSHYHTTVADQEANARLIAAAPIGLDMAKDILEEWYAHDSNMMKAEPRYVSLARQFIAKAEGR